MGREVEKDADEYAKLVRNMNPPRVVIDNESCDDATVIQVDSFNRDGFLLQVVQVIADLNLVITKAYISSDGSWFMEVFNVIDREGKKVKDQQVLSAIKKTLEESDDVGLDAPASTVGVSPSSSPDDDTTIELAGADRPGLLSDICAILVDHGCAIHNAECWTHNGRFAAVFHVAIADPSLVGDLTATIRRVVCLGADATRDVRAAVLPGSMTHHGRRLHKLMLDDGDYRKIPAAKAPTSVSITSSPERGYTVVVIRCKDRAKLLFDTVCALTDMGYVVHHGTVTTVAGDAYNEYYIRHVDGSPVCSDAERQRLIQCLRAAIDRRSSEGVRLELTTEDRMGLLSKITRAFREHGLTINRAEITTVGGKAVDTFYVTDASGADQVKPETIRSIETHIGHPLRQKDFGPHPPAPRRTAHSAAFLFSHLFKLYHPF